LNHPVVRCCPVVRHRSKAVRVASRAGWSRGDRSKVATMVDWSTVCWKACWRTDG